MPANAQPIFSKIGDIQWGAAAITAANTAKDGTGTVTTIFTADITNGGLVDDIVIAPIGTNVQTVLRVFINNGSTNATPANNVLIDEVVLPATTLTETDLMGIFRCSINRALPPGYKINVVLATAIAAGVMVSANGGKY